MPIEVRSTRTEAMSHTYILREEAYCSGLRRKNPPSMLVSLAPHKRLPLGQIRNDKSASRQESERGDKTDDRMLGRFLGINPNLLLGRARSR